MWMNPPISVGADHPSSQRTRSITNGPEHRDPLSRERCRSSYFVSQGSQASGAGISVDVYLAKQSGLFFRNKRGISAGQFQRTNVRLNRTPVLDCLSRSPAKIYYRWDRAQAALSLWCSYPRSASRRNPRAFLLRGSGRGEQLGSLPRISAKVRTVPGGHLVCSTFCAAR